jgi:hypothetical protein
MPALGAPKPPGGGGGKQINLGVPDPNAAPPGAGPPPGGMGAGGPPPGPAPDGGGGGPPAPDGGLGAGAENMNFPELHVDGLDEGSGIQDLPDEGHARIHYKVTGRGSSTDKHGKHKGKKKHHVSMEVHHITPEGDGKQKESEADGIRQKAKQFFQAEDAGSRAAAQGGDSGGAPSSEMPA